jgi:cytochrome bd-type quinol oxidase subunit 2
MQTIHLNEFAYNLPLYIGAAAAVFCLMRAIAAYAAGQRDRMRMQLMLAGMFGSLTIALAFQRAHSPWAFLFAVLTIACAIALALARKMPRAT